MKVQIKELAIPTPNGYSLSASVFFSKNDIGQTLVISSATGVLQRYYSKFASFFAAQGFTVYTFDYQGIGKSGASTARLKKHSEDLKSWGKIDQATVVAFAKKEKPGTLLTLVAHSIGGQLIGFNPNHYLLDKVVMVASQGGYWKNFKGVHLLKMWLLWYVIIPGLTPLYGFFPSKKLGLFENLPKNMVYEWAKWGKEKEYMMHFYDKEDYYFDTVKVAMLSWSFPHDSFAPKKTVDWMTDQYRGAQVKRVHYIPEKGTKQVRHFGFFKLAFKEPLWQQTLQWVLNDNLR
ncbi:hypothetical protein MNBD_BACTEROID03-1853 [hydrothermal vent metagenome]|uniref:Serine aminopeptidase S33 domain-containing protein n=1 Tax=hydrothermal vent metagenome TaxID=652676 RepID=A0A3B0TMW5_9ZZZZ